MPHCYPREIVIRTKRSWVWATVEDDNDIFYPCYAQDFSYDYSAKHTHTIWLGLLKRAQSQYKYFVNQMFCEQFLIRVLHSSFRKYLFLKFEQSLLISYRIKNITIIIVTNINIFYLWIYCQERQATWYININMRLPSDHV